MERQDWINKKTKFLIQKENYKPEQAYAIAISMYNRGDHKEDGGYLPEYQPGGNFFTDTLNSLGSRTWSDTTSQSVLPITTPTVPTSNIPLMNNYGVPINQEVSDLSKSFVPLSQQGVLNNSLSYGIPQNKNYGMSVTATAQPIVNKPQVKVTAQQKQPTVSTIAPVNKQGVISPTNPVVQQTASEYTYSGAKPLYSADSNSIVNRYEDFTYTGDKATFDPAQGTDIKRRFEDTDYKVGDANLDGVIDEKDKVDKFGNPLTTPSTFQPNERIQFFNPYAGVDIPTAATALGQFVENDNTLGIAGSGVKLATGLARNFFGGMGLQRRNNQVMSDYYEKQREGLNRPEVLQKGGTINANMYNYEKTGNTDITPAQAQQINETTGIQFTPEFAQAYFSTDVAPEVATPPVDYSKLPIRDITSDGQFTNRKVWRTQRPEWFVGKQTPIEGKDYTTIPYKKWKEYQNSPEYVNYMNPMQNSSPVADNQMFQDGGNFANNISTVGNTNKSIFEQQFLNDLAKDANVNEQLFQDIISRPVDNKVNYLKSVGITYGTPEEQLQKPSPFIGMYQDGGVQQEEQMQNIEQQIVESLQKGIQPEQIVQNLVQQGVPEEQVVQMIQAIIQQFQGAPEQGQQFMQDGGSINNKDKMSKALTGEYIFGMDKNNPIQRPNSELEHGEYLQHPNSEIQKVEGKKHSDGGEDMHLENNTKILSDHLKPKIDFVRKLKKDYGIDVKSSDTYSKILEKYSKKIGLSQIVDEQEDYIKKMEKVVTTNKDEEALGLNTQYLSEKLKTLEDRKAPLEETRKSFFNELFKEQEDSKPKEEKDKFQNGGNFNDAILQLAQKYNIPQEEISNIFKDGGLKLPEYQDGVLTDTSKIPYTDRTRLEDMYAELRGRGYTGSNKIGDMQAWMVKNNPEEVVSYFTKSGQPLTAKHVDIIKDKYKDAFTKAGISSSKASAAYTPEEKLRLKEALGEKATNEFYLEGFHDNKWDWRMPVLPADMGVQATTLAGQQPTATPLPNFYQAPEVTQAQVPASTENLTEERRKGNMNMLLFPDQSPMLPDSLQAHLKVNRRFDRINPALVSPEQALQELNRQTVATKERLNTGAGAERIAGELGLSATTQDNINKIVTDTEKLNSQIISNTDARNATIQAAEENAAASDALSFEQRQLRAKALTDADINNYYNFLRASNMKNWDTVNKINILNQMNPDFQYTNEGIEKTSPNVQWNTQNMNIPSKTEVTTKKSTTKKRNGGRFKS